MGFHLKSTWPVNLVELGHALGSLDPAVTRLPNCRGLELYKWFTAHNSPIIYIKIIANLPPTKIFYEF